MPKAVFLFLLCLTFAFSAFGCGRTNGVDTGEQSVGLAYKNGFSINYLDVGEGDAIFINFGDGKTMLIDCGEENERNLRLIEKFADFYAGDFIDYLVITHPDGDHAGNAAAIAERYGIGKAFIPYIIDVDNYGFYAHACEKIDEKGVEREYSKQFSRIEGGDYRVLFLSPRPRGTSDSAYDVFNSSLNPTAEQTNDLSPIIYLDYKGVRFLFTGDAGFSQEKIVLDDYKSGCFDAFYGGVYSVNLNGIDFLKVAHHGADDASGAEFLRELSPANAVISVCGDNRYGHPSAKTLKRVYDAKPDCKVYTTAEHGTISVRVDGNGKIIVITQADE